MILFALTTILLPILMSSRAVRENNFEANDLVEFLAVLAPELNTVLRAAILLAHRQFLRNIDEAPVRYPACAVFSAVSVVPLRAPGSR